MPRHLCVPRAPGKGLREVGQTAVIRSFIYGGWCCFQNTLSSIYLRANDLIRESWHLLNFSGSREAPSMRRAESLPGAPHSTPPQDAGPREATPLFFSCFPSTASRMRPGGETVLERRQAGECLTGIFPCPRTPVPCPSCPLQAEASRTESQATGLALGGSRGPIVPSPAVLWGTRVGATLGNSPGEGTLPLIVMQIPGLR